MPRFVILEHDHPYLHWDLMFELGLGLRTWRLAVPPSIGQVITAKALPDHRMMYLDYEGAVSGGRGKVRRWDCGEFEQLPGAADCMALRLDGKRVQGWAYLRVDESGVWRFALESEMRPEPESLCFFEPPPDDRPAK